MPKKLFLAPGSRGNSFKVAAGIIRQLPEVVANQIAAGEVVDRPASVVKELVENSLDAGAGRIDIDISSGGIRRVQVRDDGMGMSAEDLPMAVARHATSKIKSIDDLNRLTSMGFRGEALPSIASVSHFRISSKRREDNAGSLLQVDGGRVQPLQPASHPAGTTVEVCDLFFNTPARRKFVRAERTESMHINDVIHRLALANCGTGFRVRYENGTAKVWAAATLQQRVSDVLGKVVMDKLVRVEAERDGMKLTGWLSSRGQGMRQALSRQFTFINSRGVRDRKLSAAINRGCSEYFAGDTRPVWVLFLQLDPATVDVNAHPAKSEVRLRHGHDVFDFISAATRSTLGGSGNIFSMRGGATPQHSTAAVVRQTMQSYSNLAAPGSAVPSAVIPAGRSEVPPPVQARGDAAVAPVEQPALPSDLPQDVIAGRYIVLPDREQLLLLDMVAARRILLHRALKDVSRVVSRPLLIAEVQQAPGQVIEWAQQHDADLGCMGMQVEGAGPGMLALRAVPAACGDLDEKSFFKAFLAQVQKLTGKDGSRTLDAGQVLELLTDTAVANSYAGAGELQAVLKELKSLPPDCWRSLKAADLKKLLREKSGQSPVKAGSGKST